MIRMLLLALLLLLAPVASDAQEAETVPGTNLRLVPIPGYQATADFAGFASAATGGSIVVGLLPAAAFAEIATDADLGRLAALFGAQRGIALDSAEMTEIDGREALLMRGTQEGNGTVYRKWIAFIGGESTVMLSVQAPGDTAPTDADVVAMLASVRIGAPPTIEDKIAALPFSLSVTAPFRPVNVMGGTTLLLTLGEADTVPELEQPILIVGMSVGPAPPPGTAAAFARRRLGAYPTFTTATLISETVQGEPGAEIVEILASADHARSGEPLKLVQWLHILDGGYLLVVGMARADAFDAVLTEMRAVHDGIALR